MHALKSVVGPGLQKGIRVSTYDTPTLRNNKFLDTLSEVEPAKYFVSTRKVMILKRVSVETFETT